MTPKKPWFYSEGVLNRTNSGWTVGRVPLVPDMYSQLLNERVVTGGPGRPRHVGGSAGTCRVCRGTASSGATFKKNAHVLPQALGNRTLLTLAECDACNEFVGGPLEDSLVKLVSATRSFSALKTVPQGRPKHRAGRDGSFIWSDKPGHTLVGIADADPSVGAEADNKQRLLTVSAKTQLFSPMKVGKALARAAFLAIPEGLVWQFAAYNDWICGRADMNCVVTIIAGGGPEAMHTTLDVYRRRGNAGDTMPEWVVALGFSWLLLTWHPPTLGEERGLYPAPSFGLGRNRHGVAPTFSRFFVMGEATTTMKTKLTATYETRRTVDRSVPPTGGREK